MKPRQGDFVFWEYSNGFGPSTYLGAEVLEVKPGGFVQVQGYGTMCFKPVYVTDKETGIELQKRLMAAEHEQKEAIKAANAKFVAARNEIIPKRS